MNIDQHFESVSRTVAAAFLLSVTACGGGGGSSPEQPATTNNTAGSSVSGAESSSAAPSADAASAGASQGSQNAAAQQNSAQTQPAGAFNRAQIVQYIDQHCPYGFRSTAFDGAAIIPRTGKCLVGTYQGIEIRTGPTKRCNVTITEDISTTYVVEGITIGTFPIQSEGLYYKARNKNGDGYTISWSSASADNSKGYGTIPSVHFDVHRDPEDGDVPVITVFKNKEDGNMEYNHQCAIESGTPTGQKVSF